jgi:5'-nucleotidase
VGNVGPLLAGVVIWLGVGHYRNRVFWLVAACWTLFAYAVQFAKRTFGIDLNWLLGPEITQSVEPVIRERLRQVLSLDQIKDLSLANSNLVTGALCIILYILDAGQPADQRKDPPSAPEAGTVHVKFDPIQVQSTPFRIESEPIRVAAEPIRVVSEPVRVTAEPLRVVTDPARPATEPTASHDNSTTIRLDVRQAKVDPAIKAKDTQSEPARARRPVKFTILQINDVYRVEGLKAGKLGGLARVRSIRKQLEKEGPVFLLHAGDLLSPSVMAKYVRSGPMIRCLNQLDGDSAGYDHKMVVTLGNHEFDGKDPADLLGAIAQSDFAWVSSNVFYRTCKDGPMEPLSNRVPNIRDTVILTDEDTGLRIGVFGVTLDYQKQDYVHYVYSQDGTAARHETARRAIASLRALGADMIVALTHQDMAGDKALAARFPAGSPEGIDLIAGGHEHFNQIVHADGGTWISKADSDARTANRIDVAIDGDRRVTVYSPIKIVLDDNAVIPDPLVKEEVQRAMNRLMGDFEWLTGRKLDERLGEAGELLDGFEEAVRGRETALGDILADLVQDALGAEVAFINGGSIRINDEIPKGAPITAGELEGIFYYDNKLVTTHLKGEQLRQVLEAGVAKVNEGDGRFLHVAGLHFTYHIKDGDPVPKVGIDDVKVYDARRGAFFALEPDRSYKVGTIQFLLRNAVSEGIPVLAQVTADADPDPKSLFAVVREQLRALEKDKKPISARDFGPRIVRDAPKAAMP